MFSHGYEERRATQGYVAGLGTKTAQKNTMSVSCSLAVSLNLPGDTSLKKIISFPRRES